MRGYQKKVVYLKNIDSSMFEEAYFIIKSDGVYADTEKCNRSSDLLQEANRIIEENTVFDCKKRDKRLSAKGLALFVAGFLLSSGIFICLLLF